jgi:hypothetical protein
MSIHEGRIRDIGRLVRVESGDLRCHLLAAVELESGSASGRDSLDSDRRDECSRANLPRR